MGNDYSAKSTSEEIGCELAINLRRKRATASCWPNGVTAPQLGLKTNRLSTVRVCEWKELARFKCLVRRYQRGRAGLACRTVISREMMEGREWRYCEGWARCLAVSKRRRPNRKKEEARGGSTARDIWERGRIWKTRQIFFTWRRIPKVAILSAQSGRSQHCTRTRTHIHKAKRASF